MSDPYLDVLETMDDRSDSSHEPDGETEGVVTSLREWLGQWKYSPKACNYVVLSRLSPETYKGHNIAGQTDRLTSADHDEDWIHDKWGGGTFRVVAHQLGAGGKVLQAPGGMKVVQIAGDPIAFRGADKQPWPFPEDSKPVEGIGRMDHYEDDYDPDDGRDDGRRDDLLDLLDNQQRSVATTHLAMEQAERAQESVARAQEAALERQERQVAKAEAALEREREMKLKEGAAAQAPLLQVMSMLGRQGDAAANANSVLVQSIMQSGNTSTQQLMQSFQAQRSADATAMEARLASMQAAHQGALSNQQAAFQGRISGLESELRHAREAADRRIRELREGFERRERDLKADRDRDLERSFRDHTSELDRTTNNAAVMTGVQVRALEGQLSRALEDVRHWRSKADDLQAQLRAAQDPVRQMTVLTQMRQGMQDAGLIPDENAEPSSTNMEKFLEALPAIGTHVVAPVMARVGEATAAVKAAAEAQNAQVNAQATAQARRIEQQQRLQQENLRRMQAQRAAQQRAHEQQLAAAGTIGEYVGPDEDDIPDEPVGEPFDFDDDIEEQEAIAQEPDPEAGEPNVAPDVEASTVVQASAPPEPPPPLTADEEQLLLIGNAVNGAITAGESVEATAGKFRMYLLTLSRKQKARLKAIPPDEFAVTLHNVAKMVPDDLPHLLTQDGVIFARDVRAALEDSL